MVAFPCLPRQPFETLRLFLDGINMFHFDKYQNRVKISLTKAALLILIGFVNSCMEVGPSKSEWKKVYGNPDMYLGQELHLTGSDIYIYGRSVAPADRPFAHYVIHLTHNGKVWKEIKCDLPNTTFLYEVVPIKSGHLLGCSKKILESTDNGLTWIDIQPDIPNDGLGQRVVALDESHWVSEKRNRVLHTTNNGGTWTEQLLDIGMMTIVTVRFPDNQTGYIAGGSRHDATNVGFILKTSNGGESWIRLTDDFPHVKSMHFISADIGYVNTSDTGLYKTIDGGKSWTLVNNEMLLCNDIYFVSEQEGYYCARNKIFRTMDGGRSWALNFQIGNEDYDANNQITELAFDENGLGYCIIGLKNIYKQQ